ELHITLVIRERWIGRHIAARLAVRRSELLEIAGNELELAAMIVDRKRPRIPNREVLGTQLGLVEVNRGKQRSIRAVRQLALLWRIYRADALRPVRIVELCQTVRTVKDKVILERHVADGNVFLGDERQVAIRSSDRKQTSETDIDLRCSEPMKMTVIPVQPLRHVSGYVVGVGVGHSRRDVQHDVVGIALRTDMRSMRVEIDW